jgi:hypothetical protein
MVDGIIHPTQNNPLIGRMKFRGMEQTAPADYIPGCLAASFALLNARQHQSKLSAGREIRGARAFPQKQECAPWTTALRRVDLLHLFTNHNCLN